MNTSSWNNESTPLLANDDVTTVLLPTTEAKSSHRIRLFQFLEAKTKGGLIYERINIFLIILSVVCFVASSLFVKTYNPGPLAEKCGQYCDAIWFGNYPDNALSSLGIGATSVVEISIVAIFTVDYVLRLYTADLIDPRYQGFAGRLRFIFSFYSIVDLVSTVPFYVDAFLLPNKDLATSNYIRMFRLFRMMRVEGRYDLALNLLDDVIYEQRGILTTALFVGITVWGVMSSLFYIAERRNHDMIYCGSAPEICFQQNGTIDTRLCDIDEWGFVDCSAAGCKNIDGKESCWNVYRSIVDSSFWTLMELFGEFPLVDQHSAYGKVLGTITAVFACAVFALPAGIFGSGFEEQIARRRRKTVDSIQSQTQRGSRGQNNDALPNEVAYSTRFASRHSDEQVSFRRKVFQFMHIQNTLSSRWFETVINFFVVGTVLSFMFSTMSNNDFISPLLQAFDLFDFIAVVVFTIEYLLRIYSIPEDSSYSGCHGRLMYALEFLPLANFLSFMPYWVEVFIHGKLIISHSDKHILEMTVIKFLRLLRIFKVEKYTRAFASLGNILHDNLDVLGVTGFSALVLWIFFSVILYYTERDNPNTEIANYYKTVPHAMWITLLNLSGECPLAHYSVPGKFVMGIIGLFATAIFGVPIGILGAGFEDAVMANEDEIFEDDTCKVVNVYQNGFQASCYRLVNGIGSKASVIFELIIYSFIILTVVLGVVQTLPGYENVLWQLEWIAIVIFTIEYMIRLVAAGADPTFRHDEKGWFRARADFVVSFYSVIDLLAIAPFYLAYIMPGSWFDKHDEYFRMLRLLRLLKLDKYFPSISLIDDVLRLKKRALITSCFAAGTLWILFTGLMYLAEFKDSSMDISDLPLYDCYQDCSMSVRYENYFTSFTLTGIHLTGDYPMTEYGALGRIVCFFMVIAAVGVVSVPSGLIASGFTDIVQSKTNKRQNMELGHAGDDWFDIKFRELQNIPAPNSVFGRRIDRLQTIVVEYLDGKINRETGMKERSLFSQIGRFSFLFLIIANVIAVIVESIPEVDRYMGNEPGNFFDVFEDLSVGFFTLEYALRLFSASKSRHALYSPWIYAITFFGMVDFISIAPWYIEWYLQTTGRVHGDVAKIFRVVRIFRVLQLEDFIVAFSKLDNVFRASKSVLKATGLMALIIWVGASALFYLFEQNNPNFRTCHPNVPRIGTDQNPGCYDFESTDECNTHYPDMCYQAAFTNMPNTMFYVAVFLGGDWGFVDFTWKGKLVCIILCISGIALYAIPVGTLFDSFGAVIGLNGDDDDEDPTTEEESELKKKVPLQQPQHGPCHEP